MLVTSHDPIYYWIPFFSVCCPNAVVAKINQNGRPANACACINNYLCYPSPVINGRLTGNPVKNGIIPSSVKSSLTNVHSTATQTCNTAAKNGDFSINNACNTPNGFIRRNCVLSPCITTARQPYNLSHKTNYQPSRLITHQKPAILPCTAAAPAITADSLVPSTSYLNMAESNTVFVHPNRLITPGAHGGKNGGVFPLNFVYKNIREELLKSENVSCNSPDVCSRWKVFRAFFYQQLGCAIGLKSRSVRPYD